MARSPETIRQSILDAIAAKAVLAGLSPSVDAEAAAWVEVLVEQTYLLEVQWDTVRAELQATAARAKAGNKEWYHSRLLEFQYRDGESFPLTVTSDGVAQYATIDEAARIIAKASVVETSEGNVFAKVAKRVSGVLQQLAAEELSTLQGYIDRLKFMGPAVQVQSLPADLLRITQVVRYQKAYTEADVRARVEAAIAAYIDAIDFNGVFYTNRMEQQQLALSGVIDVVTNSVLVAPATLIVNSYQLASGYARIDPAFPLSATITYQPV